MATTGRLRLTIIEAKLTRDTEMFSKMDPYCKVRTRDQNFKTKVLQGAGKLPKWNETIDIDVKYIGDDINIEVMDEDVTTSDLIGSVVMKISGLTMNGGMDEWFDLQYKGKKCGAIHLKGDWKPTETKANQAANMLGAVMGGHQAPQFAPVYGQQQPHVVVMQQPQQPYNQAMAMNVLGMSMQGGPQGYGMP
jgi:hypothetical protein